MATTDDAGDGTMTRARALRELGLGDEDEGVVNEKMIRARYRALCLEWHPDKRPANEAVAATRKFTSVTCAYHALTRVNFDEKRWRATYAIPPLQSLEDVLARALGGGCPFEIEAMLRRRGEYRPNERFGIDVHVPWEAGERPEADFSGVAAYSRTRALGDGRGADEAREMEIAWAAGKMAGGSDDRPWERVGGVGYDGDERVKKSLGWRPLIPERAGRPDASAEELNDEGMDFYVKKRYDEALSCYCAAIEKEPGKVAYQGNVAAAALLYASELRDGSPEKIESLQLTVSACEAAIALDDGYTRGYVRMGKALLALGDATEDAKPLRRAKEMLTKALELDASSVSAKKTLKDVQISLQLYDSDSD